MFVSGWRGSEECDGLFPSLRFINIKSFEVASKITRKKERKKERSVFKVKDTTSGVGTGGEGCLPGPFFENWKKYPDFGKNILIVFIYGLNFSSKMLF